MEKRTKGRIVVGSLIVVILLLGLAMFLFGQNNLIKFNTLYDRAEFIHPITVGLNSNRDLTTPEFVPIKPHHYFQGWMLHPDQAGNYITSTRGLRGGTTLFAHWTPLDFTAALHANGINIRNINLSGGQALYSAEHFTQWFLLDRGAPFNAGLMFHEFADPFSQFIGWYFNDLHGNRAELRHNGDGTQWFIRHFDEDGVVIENAMTDDGGWRTITAQNPFTPDLYDTNYFAIVNYRRAEAAFDHDGTRVDIGMNNNPVPQLLRFGHDQYIDIPEFQSTARNNFLGWQMFVRGGFMNLVGNPSPTASGMSIMGKFYIDNNNTSPTFNDIQWIGLRGHTGMQDIVAAHGHDQDGMIEALARLNSIFGRVWVPGEQFRMDPLLYFLSSPTFLDNSVSGIGFRPVFRGEPRVGEVYDYIGVEQFYLRMEDGSLRPITEFSNCPVEMAIRNATPIPARVSGENIILEHMENRGGLTFREFMLPLRSGGLTLFDPEPNPLPGTERIIPFIEFLDSAGDLRGVIIDTVWEETAPLRLDFNFYGFENVWEDHLRLLYYIEFNAIRANRPHNVPVMNEYEVDDIRTMRTVTGTTIALPSASMFAMANMSFSHWRDASGNTVGTAGAPFVVNPNSEYIEIDEETGESIYTLYAVWVVAGTNFAFDLNGGRGFEVTPELAFQLRGAVGDDIALPTNIPTRYGYTFDGWAVDGEPYPLRPHLAPDGEEVTLDVRGYRRILTAVWIPIIVDVELQFSFVHDGAVQVGYMPFRVPFDSTLQLRRVTDAMYSRLGGGMSVSGLLYNRAVRLLGWRFDDNLTTGNVSMDFLPTAAIRIDETFAIRATGYTDDAVLIRDGLVGHDIKEGQRVTVELWDDIGPHTNPVAHTNARDTFIPDNHNGEWNMDYRWQRPFIPVINGQQQSAPPGVGIQTLHRSHYQNVLLNNPNSPRFLEYQRLQRTHDFSGFVFIPSIVAHRLDTGAVSWDDDIWCVETGTWSNFDIIEDELGVPVVFEFDMNDPDPYVTIPVPMAFDHMRLYILWTPRVVEIIIEVETATEVQATTEGGILIDGEYDYVFDIEYAATIESYQHDLRPRRNLYNDGRDQWGSLTSVESNSPWNPDGRFFDRNNVFFNDFTLRYDDLDQWTGDQTLQNFAVPDGFRFDRWQVQFEYDLPPVGTPFNQVTNFETYTRSTFTGDIIVHGERDDSGYFSSASGWGAPRYNLLSDDRDPDGAPTARHLGGVHYRSSPEFFGGQYGGNITIGHPVSRIILTRRILPADTFVIASRSHEMYFDDNGDMLTTFGVARSESIDDVKNPHFYCDAVSGSRFAPILTNPPDRRVNFLIGGQTTRLNNWTPQASVPDMDYRYDRDGIEHNGTTGNWLRWETSDGILYDGLQVDPRHRRAAANEGMRVVGFVTVPWPIIHAGNNPIDPDVPVSDTAVPHHFFELGQPIQLLHTGDARLQNQMVLGHANETYLDVPTSRIHRAEQRPIAFINADHLARLTLYAVYEPIDYRVIVNWYEDGSEPGATVRRYFEVTDGTTNPNNNLFRINQTIFNFSSPGGYDGSIWQEIMDEDTRFGHWVPMNQSSPWSSHQNGGGLNIGVREFIGYDASGNKRWAVDDYGSAVFSSGHRLPINHGQNIALTNAPISGANTPIDIRRAIGENYDEIHLWVLQVPKDIIVTYNWLVDGAWVNGAVVPLSEQFGNPFAVHSAEYLENRFGIDMTHHGFEISGWGFREDVEVDGPPLVPWTGAPRFPIDTSDALTPDRLVAGMHNPNPLDFHALDGYLNDANFPYAFYRDGNVLRLNLFAAYQGILIGDIHFVLIDMQNLNEVATYLPNDFAPAPHAAPADAINRMGGQFSLQSGFGAMDRWVLTVQDVRIGDRIPVDGRWWAFEHTGTDHQTFDFWYFSNVGIPSWTLDIPAVNRQRIWLTPSDIAWNSEWVVGGNGLIDPETGRLHEGHENGVIVLSRFYAYGGMFAPDPEAGVGSDSWSRPVDPDDPMWDHFPPIFPPPPDDQPWPPGAENPVGDPPTDLPPFPPTFPGGGGGTPNMPNSPAPTSSPFFVPATAALTATDIDPAVVGPDDPFATLWPFDGSFTTTIWDPFGMWIFNHFDYPAGFALHNGTINISRPAMPHVDNRHMRWGYEVVGVRTRTNDGFLPNDTTGQIDFTRTPDYYDEWRLFFSYEYAQWFASLPLDCSRRESELRRLVQQFGGEHTREEIEWRIFEHAIGWVPFHHIFLTIGGRPMEEMPLQFIWRPMSVMLDFQHGLSATQMSRPGMSDFLDYIENYGNKPSEFESFHPLPIFTPMTPTDFPYWHQSFLWGTSPLGMDPPGVFPPVTDNWINWQQFGNFQTRVGEPEDMRSEFDHVVNAPARYNRTNPDTWVRIHLKAEWDAGAPVTLRFYLAFRDDAGIRIDPLAVNDSTAPLMDGLSADRMSKALSLRPQVVPNPLGPCSFSGRPRYTYQIGIPPGGTSLGWFTEFDLPYLGQFSNHVQDYIGGGSLDFLSGMSSRGWFYRAPGHYRQSEIPWNSSDLSPQDHLRMGLWDENTQTNHNNEGATFHIFNSLGGGLGGARQHTGILPDATPVDITQFPVGGHEEVIHMYLLYDYVVGRIEFDPNGGMSPAGNTPNPREAANNNPVHHNQQVRFGDYYPEMQLTRAGHEIWGWRFVGHGDVANPTPYLPYHQQRWVQATDEYDNLLYDSDDDPILVISNDPNQVPHVRQIITGVDADDNNIYEYQEMWVFTDGTDFFTNNASDRTPSLIPEHLLPVYHHEDSEGIENLFRVRFPRVPGSNSNFGPDYIDNQTIIVRAAWVPRLIRAYFYDDSFTPQRIPNGSVSFAGISDVNPGYDWIYVMVEVPFLSQTFNPDFRHVTFINPPQRDGHSFVGWYREQRNPMLYPTNEGWNEASRIVGNMPVPDQDRVRVFARFAPNLYRFRFDLNNEDLADTAATPPSRPRDWFDGTITEEGDNVIYISGPYGGFLYNTFVELLPSGADIIEFSPDAANMPFVGWSTDPTSREFIMDHNFTRHVLLSNHNEYVGAVWSPGHYMVDVVNVVQNQTIAPVRIGYDVDIPDNRPDLLPFHGSHIITITLYAMWDNGEVMVNYTCMTDEDDDFPTISIWNDNNQRNNRVTSTYVFEGSRRDRVGGQYAATVGPNSPDVFTYGHMVLDDLGFARSGHNLFGWLPTLPSQACFDSGNPLGAFLDPGHPLGRVFFPGEFLPSFSTNLRMVAIWAPYHTDFDMDTFHMGYVTIGDANTDPWGFGPFAGVFEHRGGFMSGTRVLSIPSPTHDFGGGQMLGADYFERMAGAGFRLETEADVILFPRGFSSLSRGVLVANQAHHVHLPNHGVEEQGDDIVLVETPLIVESGAIRSRTLETLHVNDALMGMDFDTVTPHVFNIVAGEVEQGANALTGNNSRAHTPISRFQSYTITQGQIVLDRVETDGERTNYINRFNGNNGLCPEYGFVNQTEIYHVSETANTFGMLMTRTNDEQRRPILDTERVLLAYPSNRPAVFRLPGAPALTVGQQLNQTRLGIAQLNGIQVIAPHAFHYLNAIRDVHINAANTNSTIREIGHRAFYHTTINTLRMPDNACLHLHPEFFTGFNPNILEVTFGNFNPVTNSYGLTSRAAHVRGSFLYHGDGTTSAATAGDVIYVMQRPVRTQMTIEDQHGIATRRFNQYSLYTLTLNANLWLLEVFAGIHIGDTPGLFWEHFMAPLSNSLEAVNITTNIQSVDWKIFEHLTLSNPWGSGGMTIDSINETDRMDFVNINPFEVSPMTADPSYPNVFPIFMNSLHIAGEHQRLSNMPLVMGNSRFQTRAKMITYNRGYTTNSGPRMSSALIGNEIVEVDPNVIYAPTGSDMYFGRDHTFMRMPSQFQYQGYSFAGWRLYLDDNQASAILRRNNDVMVSNMDFRVDDNGDRHYFLLFREGEQREFGMFWTDYMIYSGGHMVLVAEWRMALAVFIGWEETSFGVWEEVHLNDMRIHLAEIDDVYGLVPGRDIGTLDIEMTAQQGGNFNSIFLPATDHYFVDIDGQRMQFVGWRRVIYGQHGHDWAHESWYDCPDGGSQFWVDIQDGNRILPNGSIETIHELRVLHDDRTRLRESQVVFYALYDRASAVVDYELDYVPVTVYDNPVTEHWSWTASHGVDEDGERRPLDAFEHRITGEVLARGVSIPAAIPQVFPSRFNPDYVTMFMRPVTRVANNGFRYNNDLIDEIYLGENIAWVGDAAFMETNARGLVFAANYYGYTFRNTLYDLRIGNDSFANTQFLRNTRHPVTRNISIENNGREMTRRPILADEIIIPSHTVSIGDRAFNDSMSCSIERLQTVSMNLGLARLSRIGHNAFESARHVTYFFRTTGSPFPTQALTSRLREVGQLAFALTNIVAFETQNTIADTEMLSGVGATQFGFVAIGNNPPGTGQATGLGHLVRREAITIAPFTETYILAVYTPGMTDALFNLGSMAGTVNTGSDTVTYAVSRIGNFAFAYHLHLRFVIIPSTVGGVYTQVGHSVFAFMQNLENVYIEHLTPGAQSAFNSPPLPHDPSLRYFPDHPGFQFGVASSNAFLNMPYVPIRLVAISPDPFLGMANPVFHSHQFAHWDFEFLRHWALRFPNVARQFTTWPGYPGYETGTAPM